MEYYKEYKENVYIDVFKKRPKGKIYRDVRFHVGNKCITIEDLITPTNEAAYEKAKGLLKKALEL